MQPRFRKVLCAALSALVLVSLLAPGIPLMPMEQTDPLAQQEIRDIEPVRLGDEADGSNAIIIPIEGGEDAEQTLEVSEGDGIAGEGEAQTGETRPEELLPVEVEGDEINQEQTGTGSGDQGQEDGNSGEEGGELIQPDLAAVMVWPSVQVSSFSWQYSGEERLPAASPISMPVGLPRPNCMA